MRRTSLLAVLVAAVTVMAAPDAQAFVRFQGYHWPTKTIRYFDATGKQYNKEVATAAAAWNTSGAKVKWSRTKHRGSGVVPITVVKNLFTAGLATYSYGGGRWQGKIEVQPNLKKNQLTKAAGAQVAIDVFVHEMGHIMGLNHETKRCAIMQPVVWGGCPQPKNPWQYRCRPLEKDDIRGGISIFGGKIGKIGPEFCDAAEPPPAVTGVTVVAAPDQDLGARVTVSWTNPSASKPMQAEVLRRRDTCPTGPDDKQAQPVEQVQAKVGQPQSVTDESGFPGAGSYCYAVVLIGEFNRPGKPATVVFQYTGAPSAEFRPSARFYWEPVGDGQQIQFTDDSSVNQGAIKSWHWDFGDGTGSFDPNPTHSFAPGEHTVSLTVTDDQGRTETTNDTVYVDTPVGDGGDAP